MNLTGACLCRAVCYEILPKPPTVTADMVDYCHCRQCRTASGAPVLAWLQVAPSRFRITAGAAQPFASSAHATRWFCPACGSPLYMTDAQNRSIGITLGTLDEPAHVIPTAHGWHSARLPWFATSDNLPHYPQSPPHDE